MAIHRAYFHLKWLVLTLFVTGAMFWVMVYPKLGAFEGNIDPVFEYESHYNVKVGTTQFVGLTITSRRDCRLNELIVYNKSSTSFSILYEREPWDYGTPYSAGTSLSTAPLVFNPQYLGNKLEELTVVVISNCHSLWPTVTKIVINL